MANEITSLLRISEVSRSTGLARSTIYEKISAGSFPKPIKITPKTSAWIANEVEQWVQDRINDSRTAA